jgi:hypothetical protein
MAFTPSSTPGEAVPGSAVPGSSGTPGTVVPEWPEVFTYNFCPNPSVESSLSGYVILHPNTTRPETLFMADSGYSGNASAGVTTPGAIPGEGIATPLGATIATATGSMSCWIFGNSGTLLITAVTSSGSVLGSIPVTLNGAWQRVTLTGLALGFPANVQLLIQTTITQAITFQVDAVQYEPESPAHPYIDGSFPQASWIGTPNLSASEMPFQFPIYSVGNLLMSGTIDIVSQGEIFLIGNTNPLKGPVILIEGELDISGFDHPMVATTEAGRTAPATLSPAGVPWITDTGVIGVPWEIMGGGFFLSVVVISPLGGVNNFAVWETGVDPDPAQSLIMQNNAGTHDGQTGYTQIYGMFTPPIAEPNSTGENTWQAAAFMAVGFEVASQGEFASGTPNAVNFTNVQVEKMDYSPALTPAPTSYILPRSLSTIVKPTQQNLVTNPSFEVSLAGWNAFGTGASISLDTVDSFNGEGQSGRCTVTSDTVGAGAGMYISVSDLIVGDIYTATAFVAAFSDNIQDIFLNVGALGASAGDNGSPLYGGDPTNPGYGDGPYGGVTATTVPMTEAVWFEIPLSFTALASTIQLSFDALAVAGTTGNLVFNVDAVMVQPGETVFPFADGDTDGWEWELGGTPGLSRSYFYERQQVAAQAVTQVLAQHIPLGLTAFEPEFAVPATQ